MPTTVKLSRKQIAVLLIALLFTAFPIFAQERQPKIYITGTDASSSPVVEIEAYGQRADGSPLDLSAELLEVRHGDSTGQNVNVVGQRDGGTFTLFVVDLTEGVNGDIPSIQEAIVQFASPGNMIEHSDHVAIFKVGLANGDVLLESTQFYNTISNYLKLTPLNSENKATALLDSIDGLLNNIDTLKPDPNLATSIVVFSDGTDSVSQLGSDDIFNKSVEKGVPIHTVSLVNVEMSDAFQETGNEFMAELAQKTGGISAALGDNTGITNIWTRISRLRQRTLIRYQIEDLTAGTSQIELKLTNQPNVRAVAQVDVPTAAPMVKINLPAESRELTIPEPGTPVDIILSGEVSWLDNIQREVTQAELYLNDQPIGTIDPAQIGRFRAPVTNLVIGANTVRLAIADSEGRSATSPTVQINVSQGDLDVPSGLSDSSNWLRYGAYAIGALVLIGLLMGLAAYFRTRKEKESFNVITPPSEREVPIDPIKDRVNITPDKADIPDYVQPVVDDPDQPFRPPSSPPPVAPVGSGAPTPSWAQETPEPPVTFDTVPTSSSEEAVPYDTYVEILQSRTETVQYVPIDKSDTSFGRSPTQATVSFTEDKTVSRLHASITFEEATDIYRIYDERSTSGTFVNGQRVTEYGLQLIHRDEIRLGAVRMRFFHPRDTDV